MKNTQTAYALAAVALAGCTGLTLPSGLGSLLGPSAASGGLGSLQVTVALSQRSTLALFDGISTVSIAVQDASQTVSVADGAGQLASGVASASFSDLTPGPATVSAQALDASGSVIGSAALPVTIASGSTSAALGVGVASPGPSPGPSGGTTASPSPSVSPSPFPGPAKILSWSPLHPKPGDMLTITGENLQGIVNVDIEGGVVLGDVSVPVTSDGASQITIILPSGTPASGAIVVCPPGRAADYVSGFAM